MIIITIYYVGAAEQAAQYLGPYNALGPVSSVNDSIAYPGIPDATGTGSTNALCQFGMTHVQSPVGLLTYNITSNRQAYELYKKKTLEIPAFNGSTLALQGYSLGGMKAVNPDSSAFPHRSDNILMYAAFPLSFHPPAPLPLEFSEA